MGEVLRGERFIGRRVPTAEAGPNLRIYTALHQSILERQVSAAASLGLGGLATAASKMALAGDLGMEIDLSAVITEPGDLRADRILYSESQGRILVSVSPSKEGAFLDLFEGLPCRLVGRIHEEAFLRVHGKDGAPYLEEGLPELREAYQRTLWW
jgi:phosphoribosylformylglycinamidine synthase